jgi:hypothetical protein
LKRCSADHHSLPGKGSVPPATIFFEPLSTAGCEPYLAVFEYPALTNREKDVRAALSRPNGQRAGRTEVLPAPILTPTFSNSIKKMAFLARILQAAQTEILK